MGIKTLPEESFDEASDFLLHSARALERNTYNQIFNGDKPVKSLLELKNYQNPDGGFGHGLEPDLRLPYSSPISTAVAFRHLERIGEGSEVADDLIQSGINYLESSFQSGDGRWFAAPPEINNFPHAPWWHFDESSGKTPADESWGNPTVEILAYGLRYNGFSDSIDIAKFVKKAIRRFKNKEKFESEHEIYCYLKLYKALPRNEAKEIKDRLIKAVDQLVCTEPSEWTGYVPQPVDFVTSPDSPKLGISETVLEENLNFLIDSIEENGIIEPCWEWGQYESEWERAKLEWTGLLTLKTLIILDNFDRISRN
ncbi:hypothetical protein KGY79_06600 [Candidatus Bipolaricaulota bacterium]|nr:hypothetical protein [Candidatus Bipolaricaulota bacterium]